ncbi:Tetratricopeptide repeat family [Mycena venus]|uniref:Tetratricopeptide repeat family n=1 Tax=Mycena venus TaxID=2733690 RepID=A0A8H6YH54_9AGAR|nr:Tetratricopeptide repeat family [Mycena venus]
MAHLLLETQFGQNVLNQTVEMIALDPTHKSLESQYLPAQTRYLMDSLQKCLTGGNLVLHEPLWEPTIKPVFARSSSLEVLLHRILEAVIEVNEGPTRQIHLESVEHVVADLGVHLASIGMVSEGVAWERLKIQILHSLAAGHHCVRTWPRIARALDNVSFGCQQLLQFQAALQASQ